MRAIQQRVADVQSERASGRRVGQGRAHFVLGPVDGPADPAQRFDQGDQAEIVACQLIADQRIEVVGDVPQRQVAAPRRRAG